MKLESFQWYSEGYPVRSSSIVKPYQAADSFSNAFHNVPFNGRWSVIIASSPEHTSSGTQGWEGSVGTISDWILVVTDLAGVVRTCYQDLRAEILSLPKYGTLLSSHRHSGSSSGYGEWKEIFQLEAGTHEIRSSDDRQRYLGVCNGVDTTGMNGIRSGVDGYRYCPDNFGVGPVMNNRRDGDYPEPSQFLRQERVLFYIPRLRYLGPDYFTYRIFDGPVIQSSSRARNPTNEVTIHVRDCRDNQAKRASLLPHLLCSCQSNQSYVIANYSVCQENIQSICSDLLTSSIFANLCQICVEDMADVTNSTTTFRSSSLSTLALYSPLFPVSTIGSNCISEILRAVSYVTESRLCDTAPIYQCYDEVMTSSGRGKGGYESYNYLSLETRTLNYPFSSGREYTGTMYEEFF